MRSPSELIRLDAAAIAASVGAGRLDPVEVVKAFLGEVRRRGPEINALVDRDEAAPLAAAGVLRARITAGERLPLAGVPCVLKDSTWVAGRRIAQGSRLFQDHQAPCDALPVARMRAAGAVVLGIGNMSKLGAKDVTDNPLYGETRNPRDPGRTPGGSSGGCTAALGAVADPWGFPSTLPGIASTCPMGRTVGDVASLFEIIAGAHPLDLLSVPLPAGAAPFDPVSLRVAWSPRLGLGLAVDEDVAAAVESAVERLRGCRPRSDARRSTLAAEDRGRTHSGHRGLAPHGSVR